MSGLDSLKALLQKKKQEKQELVGDKKYVRKSDLEAAKLKRIREEEEQERRAKVRGILLLRAWALAAVAAAAVALLHPMRLLQLWPWLRPVHTRSQGTCSQAA